LSATGSTSRFQSALGAALLLTGGLTTDGCNDRKVSIRFRRGSSSHLARKAQKHHGGDVSIRFRRGSSSHCHPTNTRPCSYLQCLFAVPHLCSHFIAAICPTFST